MLNRKEILILLQSVLFPFLGTSALAFFSLIKLIDFTEDAEIKPLLYFTFAIVALLISFLINFQGILKIKNLIRESSKLEEYNIELNNKLTPILIGNLEDIIKTSAIDLFKPEVENSHKMLVHIHIEISKSYRIIASTTPDSSLVRRISLNPEEGTLGATLEHSAIVVANSINSEKSGEIYSIHGEVLGNQKISEENRNKLVPSLEWIYSTPIFSVANLQSQKDEIVGILSADSHCKDGKALFLNENFHEKMNSLSHEVSPIVSALRILTQSVEHNK